MGTGSGGMGCAAVRGGIGGCVLVRRAAANRRPRRNGGCSGLHGSRCPLPGLLERLKFRNALSNLFLLGGELLLLGRELLKLLLRSCKLLLLGGKLGADALRQCFQLLAHIRRHGRRSCDGGRRGCRGDVVGPEMSLPGERASGADQGCHDKSRQGENLVAEFRSVIDDLNIFETGQAAETR